MTIASETPRRTRFRRIVDSFFGSPFAPTQLPVLRGATVDVDKLMKVARIRLLAELGKREVRQVSLDTLCDRSTMLEELRTSLEDRCILWVLRCEDDSERERIEESFPGLLRVIGYYDSEAIVVGLHTHSVMRYVLEELPDSLPIFDDIDTAYLPRDIEHALKKARIPLHHTAWVERKLREPKSWVYMTIFIYSALRALPVVFVPQFHGSIFWLWTIDIVTAVPYTWGLLEMFTAPRFLRRFAGFATTVITFMAPYIYFWAHGDNYPHSVVAFIAIMITLSVASEVWRFINERRLCATYQSLS